jgi:thiol:disulfide interchange protein DsbG
MKIYLTILVIILTHLSSSQIVKAEETQPKTPVPIQNLVDQGAQLRYLGQEHGLNGWLILQNGEEQYFYSTPDGQGILMGILFNNKGDTITLRQINALRKKEGPAIDRLAGYTEPVKPIETVKTPSVAPDFTSPESLLRAAAKPKSEQLYNGVQSANWFKLGLDSAPIIYTFIDPECPHCHDLVQKVRKSGYLEEGLVQLRLIPVGVLSENSLIEAAYLVASPNAEKDFYRHLDGEKDVLLSDKSINTQGVQRNIKLMQDWKLDMTPFSVYRARDGKVKVLQGVPEDIKTIITELR